MKRIILLATMSLLPLLAACNTMEGAGEDIQAGGSKLERSADKHKNY
ncbi:MAG: entericidin A/B family lipoprotein [Rickettsiales bacterium]|nr:entericidin A/B family lipoprotein [Rickettsiales bacterium]